MGKILNFSTFPSTLRRGDWVRTPVEEAISQTDTFFVTYHSISTWDAGGSHVSGSSMTVTVVFDIVWTWGPMHNVAWNYTDPSYMVCGRLFSTLFHNTPLRHGLFLSCIPEFLERSDINWCQHIFHQITTPPLASPRHPRPKYLIRDYTPGRKLKIQRFNVKMFEICMFYSRAISIHMLIQTRMILIQNSNPPGVTCVIVVGKCCWTKSSRNLFNNIYTWNVVEPQQRINRTVSTQRRTRVCWLVLERSIGAVGLSTLRNMLEKLVPGKSPPWIAWFAHIPPSISKHLREWKRKETCIE